MTSSPQSKDERFREVSLATVDAKLLGCGFLMILPDNSFKYIPLDRIEIKPESRAEDQPSEEQS